MSLSKSCRQVWKGWSNLINATLEGNISAVQNALDEDKAVRFYQMKVAMFMTAHLGLLELAEDMLNGGVRADEPVGEKYFQLSVFFFHNCLKVSLSLYSLFMH